MRSKAIAVLLTALLAPPVASTLHQATAAEGPALCRNRVLATDPVGDDAYAGQTGTGLESSSGDIVSVRSSLGDYGPGAANSYFTVKVRDLAPSSPQNLDLRITLDLVTDAGQTITVDARRSSVTGESGTVDGDSTGVTVRFDEGRDLIRIKTPGTAFADAAAVSLAVAEARYDSGAVLSPLADQANGGCIMRIDPAYRPPTAEGVGDLDTRVLVIDSGVNGAHPEFANLFAWWDFSSTSTDPNPLDNARGPGTWQDRDRDGKRVGDPDDPYDPDGHGSASSSMAAGRNLDPSKTASACPGCALAVAKVMNDTDGTLDGSTEDAIRWGVDVLDVDVINISIGTVAPVPAAVLAPTYEALAYARDHGVLVVVANGNGWGNAGGPGQPGGFMNYGNSPDVLSVGADDTIYTYLTTTDPEVVATFTVHGAGQTGGSYQDISGTSFSSPLTAGVAARIIGEGRRCGSTHDLSPDSLEQLIKVTAIDRADIPPTFEGYGLVNADSMKTALGVVCSGKAAPTPDALTDLYVTSVSGTERSVSSTQTAQFQVMTPARIDNVSGPMVLGTSTPAGLFDAEVFRTTVAPGKSLTVVARGQSVANDVIDFDMALYRGSGPEFAGTDRLASSGNTGAVEEKLSWTNVGTTPQVVSLVIYGWAVPDRLPFTLRGIDPATRVLDGYFLGDNLVA